MNHTHRNTAIRRLYSRGFTQRRIARRFRMTEARVWQILHEVGMSRHSRPSRLGTTRSFTGAHLPPAIKRAFREEAAREGVSMSAMITALITDELKRRGVDIRTEPAYVGEPLPLGDE